MEVKVTWAPKVKVAHLRHLDAHEDSQGEEGDQNGQATDDDHDHAVQLGHQAHVGSVQNDEAAAAEREEEARGEAFHDVLAVDSPLHEGDLSGQRGLELGPTAI